MNCWPSTAPTRRSRCCTPAHSSARRSCSSRCARCCLRATPGWRRSTPCSALISARAWLGSRVSPNRNRETGMSFIQMYGLALFVIMCLMVALWLVSLALRNSSIVDIFWGMGFVITNWLLFALTPDGFALRKWLIGVLVTLWGLRLSLYILWRNFGKPEDFRYQKWRREEGSSWWWKSLLRVF